MNSQKKMEVGTDSKFFSQSDAHPPFKYVFSHINNIKTPIRNLLSVDSVSNLKSQIILFNSKENAGIRKSKSDWEHCFI